ncbi:class I SAM-dependent methyltransferase [Aeromonas dhakensis]|uniref:class I SAM-dependent methyltransferase n=1 Tax=Aeromonas dhakensis TaxID=196024 RepID=UPI00244B8B5E|nr:methyltransferase domain-containing protein [Aeromonas dhakensis]MDH0176320.1 class I SAM-dependent methyltransferase [Aeromonas dhakensis]
MSYFLPENYVEQTDFEPGITYFDDMTCQPDVYRMAYHIFNTGKYRYIIDIGSGNGDKLAVFGDAKIYCIDLPENRHYIEKNVKNVSFIPIDLDSDSFIIPDEILKDAVVICSDVIEHLRLPEKLARDLSHFMKVSGFVIVSTPDRIRTRGLYHMGPPENRAHIREWSIQEFYNFMRDIDKRDYIMVGFTLGNSSCREHNNIIALGGVDVPNTNCITRDNVKVKCVIEYVQNSIILNRIIHFYSFLNFDFIFMVREGLKADFLSELGDKKTDYAVIKDDILLDEKTVIEMLELCDFDWVTFHQSNTIMISPWHDISLPQAFSWLHNKGYSHIAFTSFSFYKEFDNELSFFSEKEIATDIYSWAISLNNKSISTKKYPLNFIVKKYFSERVSEEHSNQIQWKIMTTFHDFFVERLTGSYL